MLPGAEKQRHADQDRDQTHQSRCAREGLIVFRKVAIEVGANNARNHRTDGNLRTMARVQIAPGADVMCHVRAQPRCRCGSGAV